MIPYYYQINPAVLFFAGLFLAVMFFLVTITIYILVRRGIRRVKNFFRPD